MSARSVRLVTRRLSCSPHLSRQLVYVPRTFATSQITSSPYISINYYASSNATNAKAKPAPYVGLKTNTDAARKKAVDIGKNYLPGDKADTFSKALFLEASNYAGGVEGVVKDFKKLNDLTLTNTQYKTLFRDALTLNYTRRQAMNAYLQQNPDLHPITKRAFDTMSKTKLLASLQNINATLTKLSNAFFGKIDVTITVAQEYDAATQKKIIADVVKGFPADVQPQVKIKVDPSLLSGRKVEVGVQLVSDTSGRNKLEKEADEYIASLQQKIDFINGQKIARSKFPVRDLAQLTRAIFDAELKQLDQGAATTEGGKAKTTVTAVSSGDMASMSDADITKTERFKQLQKLYGYREIKKSGAPGQGQQKVGM